VKKRKKHFQPVTNSYLHKLKTYILGRRYLPRGSPFYFQTVKLSRVKKIWNFYATVNVAWSISALLEMPFRLVALFVRLCNGMVNVFTKETKLKNMTVC